MAMDRGWITTAWQNDQWVLAAGGRWDLASIPRLETQLRTARPDRRGAPVCLDLAGLTALDTAGALVIDHVAERLRAEGHTVAVVGARPDICALMKEVRRAARQPCPDAARQHPAVDLLQRTGQATFQVLKEIGDLLGFLGMVTVTALRLIGRPHHFRLKPFFFHLEQTGVNALPIVGMLSFLIGVVLAYQGADQLRQFGAEIFVVNLLGIAILREIGVLMTSIIVAGRSGSAFTAQIGTMKVNQEVDAMRTLGLDPVELLVLPRMLALFVALPLLAFFASIMGLLGGALMAWAYLDITFGQFLKQLQMAVNATALFVGLVKAPVFAVVIAIVGCYEGLRVTGSAESVGLLTTRSVVVSIILVIVLDALFSILFSYLGL